MQSHMYPRPTISMQTNEQVLRSFSERRHEKSKWGVTFTNIYLKQKVSKLERKNMHEGKKKFLQIKQLGRRGLLNYTQSTVLTGFNTFGPTRHWMVKKLAS